MNWLKTFPLEIMVIFGNFSAGCVQVKVHRNDSIWYYCVKLVLLIMYQLYLWWRNNEREVLVMFASYFELWE